MRILKADKTNIDDIEKIYDNIHDEEEKELANTGWVRNVYPTRQTAMDALGRNDLFIMQDQGKVVASAVINQIQVEEYQYATWKYHAKDQEVMVLHCLAVNPMEKGKGYGKAFVKFYEKYAKKYGCMTLRMDTNVINTRARKMYQELGFEEAGIVTSVFNGIPDVRLVCLEKWIDKLK